MFLNYIDAVAGVRRASLACPGRLRRNFKVTLFSIFLQGHRTLRVHCCSSATNIRKLMSPRPSRKACSVSAIWDDHRPRWLTELFGKLALLKFCDGFENDVPYDSEAARADFVQCVLRGVPITGTHISTVVDDVGRRNIPAEKWPVIIRDGLLTRNENVFVAEPLGRVPHKIREPTRGT